VRELEPGLWWWEAVHPEWTEEDAATEEWGPEVSSYAIDEGHRLLLLDPTALPAPVEALAAQREVVIVLWIETRGALVAGDTLIDRGKGFGVPAAWANKGVPAAEILASLQPLLELPVLHVLPTHGPPTDRTALERVLA
jgi:hypothetical protein